MLINFPRYLERELVAARAELAEAKAEIVRLTKRKDECSNGWDAALAQRDLAVEALKIIGECLIMKVKFPENATAAITASMIKKVLKECGK